MPGIWIAATHFCCHSLITGSSMTFRRDACAWTMCISSPLRAVTIPTWHGDFASLNSSKSAGHRLRNAHAHASRVEEVRHECPVRLAWVSGDVVVANAERAAHHHHKADAIDAVPVAALMNPAHTVPGSRLGDDCLAPHHRSTHATAAFGVWMIASNPGMKSSARRLMMLLNLSRQVSWRLSHPA